MKTLDYILKKFGNYIDLRQPSPITIPVAYREVMAETYKELGFKVGAEIGTWTGEHAQILVEKNPELKLYCVDPYVKYGGYIDYRVENFDPAFLEAQKRTKGYNVEFIRKFSLDAAKDFPDNFFDFVYIDANHEFRHVVDDIDDWGRKVKHGGILAGHDYRKSFNRWKTHQVIYAVDAYFAAKKMSPWFALGENNKYLQLGNGVQSWMWVKP